MTDNVVEEHPHRLDGATRRGHQGHRSRVGDTPSTIESATPHLGAVCRSGVDPESPMDALAAGVDPIEGCTQLWESGVFPDPKEPAGPGQNVPPLVACIGAGGAVEVYPGPADLCPALGLKPADPVLGPTGDAVAELSNRIADEINLADCAAADDVETRVRSIIDELDLCRTRPTRRQDSSSCPISPSPSSHATTTHEQSGQSQQPTHRRREAILMAQCVPHRGCDAGFSGRVRLEYCEILQQMFALSLVRVLPR